MNLDDRAEKSENQLNHTEGRLPEGHQSGPCQGHMSGRGRSRPPDEFFFFFFLADSRIVPCRSPANVVCPPTREAERGQSFPTAQAVPETAGRRSRGTPDFHCQADECEVSYQHYLFNILFVRAQQLLILGPCPPVVEENARAGGQQHHQPPALASTPRRLSLPVITSVLLSARLARRICGGGDVFAERNGAPHVAASGEKRHAQVVTKVG